MPVEQVIIRHSEGETQETKAHHHQTTIRDLLGQDYDISKYGETLRQISEAPLHIFRFEEDESFRRDELLAIIDHPVNNHGLSEILKHLSPYSGNVSSDADHYWKELSDLVSKPKRRTKLEALAPEVSLFGNFVTDFWRVLNINEQDIFEAAQWGGWHFRDNPKTNKEQLLNYSGNKVKVTYDKNLERPVVIIDSQYRWILEGRWQHGKPDFYPDSYGEGLYTTNVLIPALRWFYDKTDGERYWYPFPLKTDHPLFDGALAVHCKNTTFDALLNQSGNFVGLEFESSRINSLMGLIATAAFTPDIKKMWPRTIFNTSREGRRLNTTYIKGVHVPMLVMRDEQRILHSPLVEQMIQLTQ